MQSTSLRPRRIMLSMVTGLVALVLVRAYFEFLMRAQGGLITWFRSHPAALLLLFALAVFTSSIAAWWLQRTSWRRLTVPVATLVGALTMAIWVSVPGAVVGFVVGLLFEFDRLRRFIKRTAFIAVRWVAPALAIGLAAGFVGRWATFADSSAMRYGPVAAYSVALLLTVMVITGPQPLLRRRRPGHAASKRAGDRQSASSFWRRLVATGLKLALISVCLVAGVWTGQQLDVYRRVRALNEVGRVGIHWERIGGYDVYLGGAEVRDKHLKLLRGLPDIASLSIQDAMITDDGFRHLAELRNLEWLHVSGAFINDAGLRHISGLPKLMHLEVRKTQATLDSFRVLATLPSLTSVMFSDLRPGGTVPRSISLPAGLRRAYFSQCGLTDGDLAFLANPSFINHLHLRDNQIRGPGLAHLAKQTSLTTLDLSHNPLDDRHLEALSGLGLIDLDVGGVHLSDTGVAAIARQRWLRSLSIRESGITDRQLRRISGSAQLQQIALDAFQLSPRSMIAWRRRDLTAYVEHRTLQAADIARLADLGVEVQLISCDIAPDAVAEFAHHHHRLFGLTDCQVQERFVDEVRRYAGMPW